MEIALRALLIADTGVAAKVSSRVYWKRRSQNDSLLPAIVLTKVSAPRDYNMDGPNNLIESRVQADCYGETYADAKTTAMAVIAAVNGFSGTVSGVVIQRVSIENERDNDGKESVADRHLYLTSIDLLIWHDE